ncbi:54S ribosomal protein L50, mitochondrial [Desmophyllum pertusum]|uniref:Large ribosomal subunit protein mL50 n=1 Tax=Desmophyllum pertusum TaxID=174260 RepID=A0A9W9YCW7_9CNID|nr:54S ribosomal protein L50, mitochondrial [Desmophyllum pertusum]
MACVSWCRFAKLKGVSRTVGKLYISTDVAKTDRLIERVKKFVFGEGAPPDRDIKETVESYYELAKAEDPAVYSMKTHEIVNKLENIVTEALPNSDEWQNQSVHDLVVKYKVLNRCFEEFGILVPNFQLNEMNRVQDVIQFYTSAKPIDTRTFKSIDGMIYHPTYLLAEACQLKMCLHNTNIHLVLKIPFV